MKEKLILKENINPLVIKAVVAKGGKSKVAKEIEKSPMAFSQIDNLQSLPGFETLALMRKVFGLNINAIVDENESMLFDDGNIANKDVVIQKQDERIAELEANEIFYKNIIETITGKKFKGVFNQAKLDLTINTNLVNLRDDFALMSNANFDRNIQGLA